MAVLVALSTLGVPGTAAAHSTAITASCAAGRTALSVQITNYTGENTVMVTDNGATLAGTSFGSEFSLRRDLDGSIDHAFSVWVKASDDPSGSHGWSYMRSAGVARCATAAAPPAPAAKPVAPRATTVPPTTTTTTSSSPAPTSSTTTSTPATTEVDSVLAGHEVPLSSPEGLSPLWIVLGCLVLLATGVTTFLIARRRLHVR